MDMDGEEFGEDEFMEEEGEEEQAEQKQEEPEVGFDFSKRLEKEDSDDSDEEEDINQEPISSYSRIYTDSKKSKSPNTRAKASALVPFPGYNRLQAIF